MATVGVLKDHDCPLLHVVQYSLYQSGYWSSGAQKFYLMNPIALYPKPLSYSSSSLRHPVLICSTIQVLTHVTCDFPRCDEVMSLCTLAMGLLCYGYENQIESQSGSVNIAVFSFYLFQTLLVSSNKLEGNQIWSTSTRRVHRTQRRARKRWLCLRRKTRKPGSTSIITTRPLSFKRPGSSTSLPSALDDAERCLRKSFTCFMLVKRLARRRLRRCSSVRRSSSSIRMYVHPNVL